jgi:hypothetical protein
MVDCSALKSGSYYMVYDNKTEKFTKTEATVAQDKKGLKGN